LILCLVLIVALVAAGCRRAGSSGPAATPTVTLTPISTPLPPVSTPVPVGVEENPVQMVLRPVASLSSARNAASQLEEVLLAESGLTVEIVLASRSAEALGALCESVGNSLAVAWLDAVSYVAAAEQDCGEPALMVDRGSDGGTGAVVQMVVNGSRGISSPSGLNGQDFCRVGYDDLYTWLVPSLVLQANGINPLDDLGSITDYGDAVELLEAVVANECDAVAVLESDLEDMDSETREALSVIDETVSLPYGVLMYPPDTPLGLRLALDDALIAIAGNPAQAGDLEDLLGQSDLERVDSGDLSSVRSFARESGLDFAAINH
jgi:ABC-type phosphate/phosphonate transport system substrate-binding protein